MEDHVPNIIQYAIDTLNKREFDATCKLQIKNYIKMIKNALDLQS
jgi:hypothetical protein